jgi:hypothetical protein
MDAMGKKRKPKNRKNEHGYCHANPPLTYTQIILPGFARFVNSRKAAYRKNAQEIPATQGSFSPRLWKTPWKAWITRHFRGSFQQDICSEQKIGPKKVLRGELLTIANIHTKNIGHPLFL